ncbi:hypothetical protein [Epilithonimonas hispanica]|uniref:Uncharacterized protein n=1 Tax=Epilithonimonas hispanica TaxID=358687 RepID=A0A3D9CZM6_9FLAO|nr:hypothetical protein [Epilithonimonas hispanica]REC71220.1 hypothetical protein DRF58_06730 [Epilithonimonas hispanica]
MKTDRYKDWESKFFEGEELTPEEELFLKNESDNPYFSFLKEEKQEKLDIKFEDFLNKATKLDIEEPKIVTLPIAKRKSYTQYWMAASLVLLMGIGGFWMFNNPENVEPQIAKHTETPKKVETPKVSPIENASTQQPVLAQQNTQPKTQKVEKKNAVENQESKTQFAYHEPKEIKKDQNLNKVNSDLEYNPNYVIINGKPVYSEQEAIAVTEDTFNFFASNVTQTINHVESAQNVSEDVIKIIKF